MSAMKPIHLLLIFWLSSSNLVGQWNAPPLEQEAYSYSIPFELKDGKIIIASSIEAETYSFLFDTGALTLLSTDLVEKYQFEKIKSTFIVDPNEKTAPAELVSLDEIHIAGLTFKDVPSISLPAEHPLISCLGIAGIIGSNMFSQSVITIDYQARMLKISDEVETTLTQTLRVNKQNMPFLTASIKRHQLIFLFDSGSNEYGTISKKDRRKLKKYSQLSRSAKGISTWTINGLGASKPIKEYKFRELQLSSVLLSGAFQVATQNSLGVEMLKHGVLILDFKSKKWDLQPYENPLHRINASYLNIMLIPTGQTWVVGQLDQRVQGIELGDQVIRMEGHDLSAFGFCDLLSGEMAKQLLGKELSVQTKRGVKKIRMQKIKPEDQ